jgi:predicted metal-dependent enzyme (double-stranded beta helix superfamily)
MHRVIFTFSQQEKGERAMFDLQKFVSECKAALADPQPSKVVESLIKEAISEPAEIREAFANADGAERHGPVIFAYRDATLSVADVTTSPGMRSPVHNHEMWAVIGNYAGQEHNRFFRYEDGALQEAGERLLREGDIAVLDAEVIHAIANPLTTESSAIHVYGGDLVARPERSMWNPDTHNREDYEITQLMAYVKELSSSS